MAEAPRGVLQAGDLLLLRDVPPAAAARARAAARPRRRCSCPARSGSRPYRARRSLNTAASSRWRSCEIIADRAVEVVEQRAEPLAAGHVQMRLGLVEQQHVRPAGEARGERDELALAAGELAGRDVVVVVMPSARRWPSASPSARSPPASFQGARTRSWWASARVIAAQVGGEPRIGEPGLRRSAAPAPARGARGGRRATVRAGRARRRRRSAGGSAAPAPGAVTFRRAVLDPAMIRSIVDLPPPLGPSTPIRALASTSRSRPRRIARPPKDW